MSCYNPKLLIDYGLREDGKHEVRFTGRPYNAINDLASREFNVDGKYVPVPCGQCIGCRLDYSRRWADRCLMEALCHDSNLFLTLTYDDEHLPAKREGSPIHSLEPKELQLFLKRLRKKFSDQKIRFFACGEYGEKNMRPHYHLILFGLRLPDLKFLRMSPRGEAYYTSESISALWKFGYHILGNCTWNTCAYVARYILKKQKGQGSNIYEEFNYEKEFCRMSRRPGIGREFIEERLDEFYAYSGVSVDDGNGGRLLRSNRYSDNIFVNEYGRELLDEIKQKRSDVALNRQIFDFLLTDTKFIDTLISDSERLSRKIDNLERSKKL